MAATRGDGAAPVRGGHASGAAADPHDPPRDSIHVRPHGLQATLRHYVADLVYGANDGIITTFAAVAGVEGGSLSRVAVLVVGAANLIADGLAMGIGNYLAISARESAREADHLPEEEAEPVRHGAAMFLAFVVAGAIPLLPYVFTSELGDRGWLSAGLALSALFGVGAGRALVTKARWWKAGLQVSALGVVAGAVAYAAGAVMAWALSES